MPFCFVPDRTPTTTNLTKLLEVKMAILLVALSIHRYAFVIEIEHL